MSTADPELDRLRFPIGRAVIAASIGPSERVALIARIAAAPRALRDAVAGLDDAALDTPYRPGGWTVRQVVHHVPDSHMNAYVRFKLAVTEAEPTVKTYEEADWARQADYAGPVGVSLDLLDALHARWTGWLSQLPEDAWGRAFLHPEGGRTTLDRALHLYAWHGEHHVAHVRHARILSRGRAPGRSLDDGAPPV